VDVAQDMVVLEEDCGTEKGLLMTPIIEGGDVVEPLRERILGRVTAADIYKPGTDEVVCEAGTLLDEAWVEELEPIGIDQVLVRSRSPARRASASVPSATAATWPAAIGQQGEAVGVIAAQSIGEPGTQLTMRTFHIGGARLAGRRGQQRPGQGRGTVKLHNIKTVRAPQRQPGRGVAFRRAHRQRREGPGEGALQDPLRCATVASTTATGRGGQIVANWDPHTHPVVTEVAGKLRFEDFIDGVTVQSKTDDVTGLASVEVIDPKQRPAAGKDLRPMVKLLDEDGQELNIAGTDLPARYFLPSGAIVSVTDGADVGVGDVLARIPQESSKTRDITGGLPRVADLFEARKPKEQALLAEATGTVSFGKDTKGKQRLVITMDDGETVETLIPKWRHVSVFEGERVERARSSPRANSTRTTSCG
jgi:DNA-directed RNA polymerase subunit beta'